MPCTRRSGGSNVLWAFENGPSRGERLSQAAGVGHDAAAQGDPDWPRRLLNPLMGKSVAMYFAKPDRWKALPRSGIQLHRDDAPASPAS